MTDDSTNVPHSVMVCQINAAVLAERERCARIVDGFDDFVYERKAEQTHDYWVAERPSMSKLAQVILNAPRAATPVRHKANTVEELEMIREKLTSEGWEPSGSHQVGTLDPVCTACGGRGLAKGRDGLPDTMKVCPVCNGNGRIKEPGN